MLAKLAKMADDRTRVRLILTTGDSVSGHIVEVDPASLSLIFKKIEDTRVTKLNVHIMYIVYTEEEVSATEDSGLSRKTRFGNLSSV